MADLDYYGADYGAAQGSRFMDAARNFGFVNWAGALTSVGLTAVMAVWAVDMTFRDVSSVPVIAALEGPMREAPENPGGQVAPFQGLALSDITSGGAAAPAPDQIVLAPPPVSLDAPALSERRVAAGLPEVDAPVAVAVTDEVAPEEDQILQASLTLIEDDLAAGALEADATDLVDTVAVDTASGPGIAQSSRPMQRPSSLRASFVSAPERLPTDAPEAGEGVQVAANTPVTDAGDVDPTSLAAGTRVVQVGAFDSEQLARGEWDRLEGKFRDYMFDKQRMIQKARSGGRDFWRLRVVGFADGADARRFCSVLSAQGAACMPVTVR